MMEQQQVRQAGLIPLRQCGKCQQGKLKAAAESHVSYLVSGYWTACELEHHHILLMGFNRIEQYESQWEGLSHILWKHRKCSKAPTRKYFFGGETAHL